MSKESKLGRGAGGLFVLALALASGGLIALSPDIALPVAVLLLPGLLALVLDKSPACGVARAVLLFQAAACVHPVLDAWYRCAGVDGCMSYLTEWPIVLRVWLSAAAAWAMLQILPALLKVMGDYRLRSRRSMLVSRRAVLAAEWGIDADRTD